MPVRSKPPRLRVIGRKPRQPLTLAEAEQKVRERRLKELRRQKAYDATRHTVPRY